MSNTFTVPVQVRSHTRIDIDNLYQRVNETERQYQHELRMKQRISSYVQTLQSLNSNDIISPDHPDDL